MIDIPFVGSASIPPYSWESCCFSMFGPHCSCGSNPVQALLSRDLHVNQSRSINCCLRWPLWFVRVRRPPRLDDQKSASGLCLKQSRRCFFIFIFLFFPISFPDKVEWKAGIVRNLHMVSTRDRAYTEESRSGRNLDLPQPFQIFDH